ncbi:MAG: hypothetical protein ABIE70_01470 [bacterium]
MATWVLAVVQESKTMPIPSNNDLNLWAAGSDRPEEQALRRQRIALTNGQ